MDKKVIMSYYVVSVLSIERSGGASAALDYSNVYYDEDAALETAYNLTHHDGVIQVIANKWSLFSDGSEEVEEDGHMFSWREGDEKPNINVFVKLRMEAEDCLEKIVCLNRQEAGAVRKFVEENGHHGYCWQGGYWTIGSPYETEEEARKAKI